MNDADALVERAEHLIDLRRTGDALDLLRQAVAASPEHVAALCETARAHLVDREFAAAREASEAALARRPDSAYAAYLRASALLGAETRPAVRADKTSKADKATGSNSKADNETVAAAELAVRLDQEFWPAYGTLANALVRAGQLDRALAAAKAAVRLAPGDASAHALLGGIADDAKQLDLSEREYQEALRLDPNHVGARVGLAAVSFGRRQVKRGADHLLAAAAQDPAGPGAVAGLRHLINLGLVIMLSGVGTSALVAIVALGAASFGPDPTRWAQMLTGSMAVLMTGGILFLLTRLPRGARRLARSMLRTKNNLAPIPVAASVAVVGLLGAFAATAWKPFLVLLVLVAVPAFMLIDQVVEKE